MKKILLTTTLNTLALRGPCHKGYAHLLRHLGGPSFDHNAPINLLTIWESNGPMDCVWALRATEQNPDIAAILIGADCLQAILPFYRKQYPLCKEPIRVIRAMRAFAQGKIDTQALHGVCSPSSRNYSGLGDAREVFGYCRNVAVGYLGPSKHLLSAVTTCSELFQDVLGDFTSFWQILAISFRKHLKKGHDPLCTYSGIGTCTRSGGVALI